MADSKLTANTHTTGSRYKKYSTLIILVVSFLLLILGMLVLNFISTNRFATLTQKLDVSSHQGAITQQLSKNLLDINLYVDTVLNQQDNTQSTQSSSPIQNPTQTIDSQSTDLAEQSINDLDTGDIVPLSDLPQIALYKIEAIQEQRDDFEHALKAFQQGGEVTLTSGETVNLTAETNPNAVKALEEMQEIWTPYLGLLDNFIAETKQGYIDKQTSDYLVDYTRLYNLALLTEANNLSSALNQQASKQTQIQIYILIIGVITAFILFFMIVFGALRQLLQGDEKLAIARQQATDILRTVNDGLFLINKDLVIDSEYSNQLEPILGTKNIAGRKLTDILNNKINDKELETTNTFVDQLYSNWVVEDLIKELNPLQTISYNYVENDTPVQKYLDFDFSRVNKGDEIDRVLVSVRDVTAAKILQDKLEKEQAQNNRQFEMISNILSMDHVLLGEFIDNTAHRIEQINETLKNTAGNTSALHQKANSIYRHIHGLKGEASALRFAAYIDLSEAIEQQTQALLTNHSLAGDDFLPLAVHLDELMSLHQFVIELNERLHLVPTSSTHNTKSTKPTTISQRDSTAYDELKKLPKGHKPTINTQEQSQSNSSDAYFEQFAQDIATRQHKQVTLDYQWQDEGLNKQDANRLKEISIQLLRNAIVHGIELPDEREQIGKSPVGQLTLNLQREANGKYQLICRDDGRGISYDKLKQSAINAGHITAEQAQSMTKNDILQLLFLPMVSTAEQVSEDAGKGVGMDIVKHEIQALGGKLAISSQINDHTQFSIKIDR